jgi:hypothetical protein
VVVQPVEQAYIFAARASGGAFWNRGEGLKIPATPAVRFRIGKRLGMPLPDRNASACQGWKVAVVCGNSTLHSDTIPHGAWVNVLPLAKRV